VLNNGIVKGFVLSAIKACSFDCENSHVHSCFFFFIQISHRNWTEVRELYSKTGGELDQWLRLIRQVHMPYYFCYYSAVSISIFILFLFAICLVHH
jgi:hypothetical protein